MDTDAESRIASREIRVSRSVSIRVHPVVKTSGICLGQIHFRFNRLRPKQANVAAPKASSAQVLGSGRGTTAGVVK